MNVLVTGACGFAGAHITEQILKQTNWNVIALDCLTYAGRLDRLAHLDRNRIKFVHHDIRSPFSDGVMSQMGDISYVIHNAAESHVRRSFANPRLFVETNAIGTLNVLEAARKMPLKSFIYISTDEVLGAATGVPFTETSPCNPTNPYSSAKACGEFLSYSYFRSFGLPVVITRTMNMFGERQHVEKFVPMTIGKILRGEEVLVHGIYTADARQVPKGQPYNHTGGTPAWYSGSRDWLHASVQGSALIFLLEHGVPGQKYHVEGEKHSNLEIAEKIAEALNITLNWTRAQSPNPVHDFTYALNGSKLKQMGWKSPATFEESFRKTVLFTKEHPEYLEE